VHPAPPNRWNASALRQRSLHKPSELWGRSTPSWLPSAMAPSGGILGSFPQVNNLGTEKPPAWSLTPAASSGGLLAQLTQPSDPAEQSPPARPPVAPPFDASLGSAWAPAAPIAHLASSHIWPLAAPSGSLGAAPFPGNSFYLSRVPPAPDWGSVPADATTGITQSVGATPGLPILGRGSTWLKPREFPLRMRPRSPMKHAASPDCGSGAVSGRRSSRARALPRLKPKPPRTIPGSGSARGSIS
jgi:hypothetical protein